MTPKEFIQSVRDEKRGFSLDQPWRLEESSLFAIIPVLRKTREKRNYITFVEADHVKVEDTGQIDYVYVENKEDKPLYISRGDIFKGKTQERAAVHGHIVQPGKGLRVAVRCVHASKGIVSGTEMEYSGKVPYDINLKSQGETWNSVTAYTTTYYHTTSDDFPANGPFDAVDSGGNRLTHPFDTQIIQPPTVYNADMRFDSSPQNFNRKVDDLNSTLRDLKDAIKDAMQKVPFIENQVGALFFKENSIVGLDIYDVPESWDSVKKDTVEKEGSNFVERHENSDLFELNPDKTKIAVQRKLKDEFEEKVIYEKEYKVVELRGKGLIGEAVVFQNKTIHITMWKDK